MTGPRYMGETPRTDDEAIQAYKLRNSSTEVVYADFARQLERDRDRLADALIKLADAVETRKSEHEGYLTACAREARALLGLTT